MASLKESTKLLSFPENLDVIWGTKLLVTGVVMWCGLDSHGYNLDSFCNFFHWFMAEPEPFGFPGKNQTAWCDII